MDDILTEQLYNELRALVERTACRKMVTPKDFDFLSGMIFDRIHEQISSFTLKRFWGYIDRGDCGRATLNILCHFVGYIDWETFCQRNNPEHKEESGEIIDAHISIHDLKRNDKVLLRWHPDREVIIRFEGMDMFTVIESKNSKLCAGDSFHANVIVANQPLVLTCLVHAGKAPTNYVCGQRHGIQFQLL